MQFEFNSRDEALEIKKYLPAEVLLFYCQKNYDHICKCVIYNPYITAYYNGYEARFTFEGYGDSFLLSTYGGVDGLRKYAAEFLMYNLGLIKEYPKSKKKRLRV